MIDFDVVKRGYNRQQVNGYLLEVQKQYRLMQEEHQSLLRIAKELENENEQLRQENAALKEDQKRFAMSSQEKTALIAEAVKQAEQAARLTTKTILQEAAFAPRKKPPAEVGILAPIVTHPSESAAYPRMTEKKQDGFTQPLFPDAQPPAEEKHKDEIDKLLADVGYESPFGKAGER